MTEIETRIVVRLKIKMTIHQSDKKLKFEGVDRKRENKQTTHTCIKHNFINNIDPLNLVAFRIFDSAH